MNATNVYEGKEKVYVIPVSNSRSLQKKGLTYLMWAVAFLDVETLKRLALSEQDKKEINDQDSWGYTVLMYLAEYGRGKEFLIPVLRENGADIRITVTGNRVNALHLCCAKTKTSSSNEVLQELLKFPDVDVNAKSRDGISALAFACASWEASASTVSILLARPDIDVNTVDAQNNTVLIALIVDAFNVLSEVAEKAKILLSDPKLDVNRKCQDGATILMFACHSRYFSHALVEYLLSLPNIDVNVNNDKGRTAISYAFITGLNSSLIRKMFERGARLTEQDAAHILPGLHQCEAYREYADRFTEKYRSQTLPKTNAATPPASAEVCVPQKVIAPPVHRYNLRSRSIKTSS